ncbi:hypothetical protein GALMADRAFT_230613 [Galerina marginata CBS 339.88]|uniref:Uncharacterized protein n=1 Tax=Galerina marginata (strain CBS 339.88) TaxID=685588 RepID=A0A067SI36_GALM3|nr:hypothetical protein GALMADRAFT_230613 [Galerina marginata CBS 339.88]
MGLAVLFFRPPCTVPTTRSNREEGWEEREVINGGVAQRAEEKRAAVEVDACVPPDKEEWLGDAETYMNAGRCHMLFAALAAALFAVPVVVDVGNLKALLLAMVRFMEPG